MEKRYRNVVAMLLSVVLVFGILPLPMFKAYKVDAAALATQGGASELVNKILGPGIEVSNISFTGNAAQGATFEDASFMPFSDGIILSTGKANSVFTPASTPLSTQYGGLGDADLTSIYKAGGFTGVTNDAASLGFTVTPTSNKISFKYIFASEEYNQDASFNDLFALYVGGENIALLPNGNTVSIGTTKNTTYHIDNTNGSSVGFLGYTTELSCEATVTPNTPVTIRLVIADAADTAFDSAVFIKASSINFVPASAPVLSNVSTTATVGANISATSDKAGTLYIVPKGSYADKAALNAVSSKITASCNSDITGNINTSGLAAGIYQVYAVDSSNIMSAPSPDITMVLPDTSQPTFSVTANPATWTNNDVTLSVSASDVGSGLNNGGAYSFDDGSTWTTSNTKSFAANGTIKIKVRDNSGNISSQDIVIDKIEKVAPTGVISIHSDKTKDGNNYVRSQAVSIDLTGEDTSSLVSQMRFANLESDLTSATWETFQAVKSGFNLTDGNGLKTVYFQLKDNAGNLSQVYSNQTYLDNIKPKLTISEPSKYVAQSGDVITYTVTFDDNSKDFGNSIIAQNQGIDSINFGIDKIILSKFGSIDLDKITKTIEDVANEPLKKLIKLSIPSGMSAEGSVNLKIAASAALDKAGNLSDETTCGYAFNMDNIAPVNQNDLLKRELRVKGGSDIKIDSTSASAGGFSSDSVRFAPASYKGASVNNATITSTPGSSLNINAPLTEGEYYLYVVDSAGNISSASTRKLIVDNSGPTFTVSEPSKTIVNGKSELEYLITFSDDSTIESINSLFVKSKIGFESTGIANAKVSIEAVTGYDRQRKVKLSYFSGDGSIDNLIIASDVARDSAGNVSLQMIESTKIIVDNTIPTLPTVDFTEVKGGNINKILNFITFKNFWNDVIKVSINAIDLGGSNLSKVYYKTSEDGEYTAVTPDTDGNITFELPIGFKGNVWTYSEDGSGNKSALVKSDGTISENNAPEIVVTPGDFSTWANEGVTINIKTTDNEGLKAIRYSVDGKETVIDMVTNFTDKQDNKEFTIAVAGDSKGHVVQINAVDLAGNNAATYNNVVKIDSTKPTIASVTGNPSDWTKDSVTLTVNASDLISELAQNAYSFDDGKTWQESNKKTYDQNTDVIVVKVKDVAGNIATYETINIGKIDKIKPTITGASDSISYFIGRVIKLNDAFGEIAGATYKNGTNTETSFKDSDLFEKAGKYALTLKDKAGNSQMLSFEIKELPKVADVVYTTECKALLDSIRTEFDKRNDLPEEYKTATDIKIKALEDRYSQIIENFKNQVDNIKLQVAAIDTNENVLISQEGKIRGLLSDIGKLSKEQQSSLQSQKDLLNSLLSKITTLKQPVEDLRTMINSLPAVDKITKQDLENINKIYSLYNDFNSEQKELLGEDSIKLLSGATDVLNKLMLHDSKTDITVTGIDGTSFTPDVYLLVTPIIGSGTSATKFSSASVSVESASKNDSVLEGKELLALYDVSLFRDNIKIQPNGKVKVKIKIPDNLINTVGLDIVHIADDGKVTPMNATVEEGYLVFITTHFSEYGIVGKVAEKAAIEKMPKTGSVIDSNVLVVGGILLCLMGTVIIARKSRKSKRTI